MDKSGKSVWPEETYEGRLKFIVSEVSQLSYECSKESKERMIGGLSWSFEVLKETFTAGQREYGDMSEVDEDEKSECDYDAMSEDANDGPDKDEVDEMSETHEMSEYDYEAMNEDAAPNGIGNYEMIVDGDNTHSEDKTETFVDYLAVYVLCNSSSESNLWSCDASVELKLLSQNNGIDGTTFETKARTLKTTFNFNKKRLGTARLISWDVLTHPYYGYVNNDELTIVAHITIKNIVGIYNIPIDFSKQHRFFSDVILTVEGCQLHVNKSFLAMHSNFFYTMFYSGFNESTKKEIVLEDVKLSHFTSMLKVIYPTQKRIHAGNVGYLLKLGNRYNVRFVMQECESFLMSTDDVDDAKKLLYADRYRMSTLQEACLEKLTTAKSVKTLTNTDEYLKMSDVTRSVLLEKLLQFVK